MISPEFGFLHSLLIANQLIAELCTAYSNRPLVAVGRMRITVGRVFFRIIHLKISLDCVKHSFNMGAHELFCQLSVTILDSVH